MAYGLSGSGCRNIELANEEGIMSEQSTTSFEGWVNSADLDPDEMDDLIQSYVTKSEVNDFKTWEENGRKFIRRGSYETTLCIASEKADYTFREFLRGLPRSDDAENAFRDALGNPNS